MTELEARANCPKWAANAVKIVDEDDSPIITRGRKHEQPKRRFFDWDRLVRRYGIVVIAAAVFTIYTIILSASVEARTEKKVRQEMAFHYASELEKYKAELAEAEQASYWTSGEASLAAQINREADFLSRVDIWTTDEAYQTFVCNVWVRVMRGDYPDSVEEVLQQPKQYDFFSLKKPIDERRHAITVELLKKLHNGIFPANLTLEHAWLEMKKDGAVCVLHSSDKYYTTNDVPWMYS